MIITWLLALLIVAPFYYLIIKLLVEWIKYLKRK